jgi:hypothetical protein
MMNWKGFGNMQPWPNQSIIVVLRILSSGKLRDVALVRMDIPRKSRFLQEPHSVTFQKMASFIVTTVKTSNLILWYFVEYCF